jgi:hypothetical protein
MTDAILKVREAFAEIEASAKTADYFDLHFALEDLIEDARNLQHQLKKARGK